MESYASEREGEEPQRERTFRAIDVAAAKKVKEATNDDPVFVIPIKLLAAEANASYDTLISNSFQWKANRYAGVKYLQYKGKLKVKARTFLRARKKLDRLEEIRDDPESHIFTEGGVSPD